MVVKDNTDAIVLSWKRCFARVADFCLYELVVYFMVYVVFNSFPVKGLFAPTILSYAPWILMILLEPLLLNKFGTTLGKFLFGLSVTTVSGNKLSYEEGLQRTGKMFLVGMGLMIPVISVLCIGNSFWKAKDNQYLFWENGSQIVSGKKKLYIYFLTVIGAVACFVLCIYLDSSAIMPKNRGNQLTKAEVEENYNAYLEYFDLAKTPELIVEEEDGKVSAVHLKVEQTDGETVCGDYGTAIACAMLAYAGADYGTDLMEMTSSGLLGLNDDGYFINGYDVYDEDFNDALGDFMISGTVEYFGYELYGAELEDDVRVQINNSEYLYETSLNPIEGAENPYYYLGVEITRK